MRLVLGVGLAWILTGAGQAQTTWTKVNEATDGQGQLIWGIAEGSPGVVAVGGGGRILHSANGTTWHRRVSGTTDWLVGVTYGMGRYIAVGDNGLILKSTDGVTWTRLASPATTARLNAVTYGQNKFVAVGEGGVVLVSTDGETWASTNAGVTGWLHGLVYAQGLWVTTGQAGAWAYSRDGVQWTKGSSGAGEMEAVVLDRCDTYKSGNYQYTEWFFLAVGGAGRVSLLNVYGYSYDNGASYTFSQWAADYSKWYQTRTTERLSSLVRVAGVYLATGGGGTLISTPSKSSSWTKIENATEGLLNATGTGWQRLVIGGENDRIYVSEELYASRLGNISTRGVAGVDASALFAGTVIRGSTPKRLLVRGVGPKLSDFAVSGALADPVLTVYNSAGEKLVSNASWGSNLNPKDITSAASQVGAFGLETGSKDAALVVSLNPGVYTFKLESASGKSGVALIEAYDLDEVRSEGPRAINISTRGRVGKGGDLMIAGLVVQGSGARRVLVRGVGPTLGSFGVPDTLADPVLEIYDAQGTLIMRNDNWEDEVTLWGETTDGTDLATAAAASGAFALQAKSKDAALVLNLVPGNYTLHLKGANDTEGNALIEAYEVPTE